MGVWIYPGATRVVRIRGVLYLDLTAFRVRTANVARKEVSDGAHVVEFIS